MKKKLLAALLVLVMLLSVMPLAAYADGEGSEVNTIAEGSTDVPESKTASSGEGTGTGSSESVDTTDTSSTGDSNNASGTDTTGVTSAGTTGDNSSGTDSTSTDTPSSTDTNVQGTVEGEDGSNAKAGTNVNADTETPDTAAESEDTSGEECEHDVVYTITTDKHLAWCLKCGHNLSGWVAHTDGNSDGVCDLCEYVYGTTPIDPVTCQHADENADGKCDYCKRYYHDSIVETTATQHRDVCQLCGYTTEWENHSDSDKSGYCDFCGTSLCTDGGGHTYDGHTCTVCGYVSHCVDENKDCICEICGNPTHSHWNTGENDIIISEDGTQCGLICDNCHKEILSNHYDIDGNGKCDFCGHEMSSTGTDSSADDSGLDDVPKTGDASLALAGLSVLFAACPILKKFVI